MTESPEELAFRALTDQITRARGICCGAYKDRCLKRRIAVRMRARGVHTFGDYSRVLEHDAHEYDLLLDALTINVTKFFRNPETWAALAPFLAERWQARQGAVVAACPGPVAGLAGVVGIDAGSPRHRLSAVGHTVAHRRSGATRERTRSGEGGSTGSTSVLDGCPERIGPGSTIANAFILHSLIIAAVEHLVSLGVAPPVWKSANAPGGDDANRRYIAEYSGRLKHL